MHTPSTRILSAIAYDRGEEYDPTELINTRPARGAVRWLESRRRAGDRRGRPVPEAGPPSAGAQAPHDSNGIPSWFLGRGPGRRAVGDPAERRVRLTPHKNADPGRRTGRGARVRRTCRRASGSGAAALATRRHLMYDIYRQVWRPPERCGARAPEARAKHGTARMIDAASARSSHRRPAAATTTSRCSTCSAGPPARRPPCGGWPVSASGVAGLPTPRPRCCVSAD